MDVLWNINENNYEYRERIPRSLPKNINIIKNKPKINIIINIEDIIYKSKKDEYDLIIIKLKEEDRLVCFGTKNMILNPQ